MLNILLYNLLNRLMFYAETNMKQRLSSEEKDREIFMLREKLKTKEAEIRHILESDSQRMAMLQSAIQNYVSKAPILPR